MSDLIKELNTVRKPLAPPPPTLKQPRIKYKADGLTPDEIVTGDVPFDPDDHEAYGDAVRATIETPVPAGYELQLVEAWHNGAAWTRDPDWRAKALAGIEREHPDASVKEKSKLLALAGLALTQRVWRYRFKVVEAFTPETFMKLDEVKDFIQSCPAPPQRKKGQKNTHAVVVNLADLQIGKVDKRGGTEALEKRFYGAMQDVVTYIKRSKPATIVLAELGDGCENFQNTPTQAQSNDRNLVRQLAMHTRFLTYAVTVLAPLSPKLLVVGVPSNHMEVRENGKAVGGPDNDYGLLSMANLKLALDLNPKAFKHVEFAWPDEYGTSIVVNVAGVNCAFTHGHYARGGGAADMVPKWLTSQFAGRVDRMDEAEIIFTGHYHHIRVQQVIGGRWWVQCPALDNGSAWLKRMNGQGDATAGILVTRVDKAGFHLPKLLGADK